MQIQLGGGRKAPVGPQVGGSRLQTRQKLVERTAQRRVEPGDPLVDLLERVTQLFLQRPHRVKTKGTRPEAK